MSDPVSITGVTKKDAQKVISQLRRAGFLPFYHAEDKSINLSVLTSGRDKTREILEAAYDKVRNPEKYKKKVVDMSGGETVEPVKVDDPRDSLIKRLADALAEYRKEYKAFRNKPLGAPGSFARQNQDARIKFEDEVDALLKEVRGS